MANVLKGIDVSVHQGKIDWSKVKSAVDFAILRCGYGRDLKGQDDSTFTENVAECEKYGIPFGVYLYSYATSVERINSEAAHVLRLIEGHKPFCVYIDMEDSSTMSLGKATLTAFAKRFCEVVKAKGYKAGVYANQNWFQLYLDVAELHKAGYSIWCAKYSNAAPNIAAKHDIWQYSSKGQVNGVKGDVDMNYMYNDIRAIEKLEELKKSITELAQEVLNGKWGDGAEMVERLTSAGYPAQEVQNEVNRLLKESKKGYSGTFPTLPKKGFLSKGNKGIQVGNLQSFLNWYGSYGLAVDNDFGTKTDAAVRDFQKREGLAVDGKFGVKSRDKAKSIKK